jgi:hypothetical protein
MRWFCAIARARLHDIPQALFHVGGLASIHDGGISCLPAAVLTSQLDFPHFCLPACLLGWLLASMPPR